VSSGRSDPAGRAEDPRLLGGVAHADLIVLLVAAAAVSTSGPMIAAITAPALAIAFWRNAFGTLATAAVVGARPGLRAEIRNLTARQLKLSAAAGVLLAAHFATWTPSLTYTTVASATALVSTQPVWTAVFLRLLGDRVSRATWIGIAIAMLGIVLLTGADLAVSGRALGGDLLALVAGALAAAYMIVGQEVRRTVSTAAYTTVCYGICAGTLLLVCLGARVELAGYDGETWLRLLGLTVMAQLLGHTLFNRVVGRVGATLAATVILCEVPGAALIAWWLLDQTPPDAVLPAGVLLLGGVYLVVRSEGRRANLPVD
jgi:drug/metabolite transporter (DMT)-like permease